jgi:hypothetical protein
MMDITQTSGNWVVHNLGLVSSEPYIFTGSNGSTAEQGTSPQISRSADGTKLFFCWTDDPNFYQNMDPEFYVKGYDVSQNKWTSIRDFSSCNLATSGLIYLPHVAAEALEPGPGIYKLSPVYAQFSSSQQDVDAAVSFHYLDNVTFVNADFSFQGGSLQILPVDPLICPGTAVTLSLTGAYQNAIWSNNVSGSYNNVNVPGIYTVSAFDGCETVSGTAAVYQLTIITSPTSTIICSGAQATFTATSNSPFLYWMPGSLFGNTYTASPASNSVYSLQAFGYLGCAVSTHFSVTVVPFPTLVIVQNPSISCIGEPVTITASGAQSYTWSVPANGASVTFSPLLTAGYSVIGANGNCTTTYSLVHVVDDCEGLKEQVGHALEIFPNPTSGNVTISADRPQNVTIFEISGKVIAQFDLDHNHFNLSGLSKGLYFVRTGTFENARFKKLVVD